MSIPAALLKEAIGTVATGPAGFGIHHEVKADANISPDTTAIDVHVNEQSLARAHDQNNGGVNKNFSKEMSRGLERIADGHRRYDDKLKRAGMDKVVDRVMNRSMLRMQHHAALKPKAASAGPAPPGLMHDRKDFVQRRAVDVMKRAFQMRKADLLRVPSVKSVPINAQTILPVAVQEKMMDEAMKKGDRVTATGRPVPVIKPMAGAGVKKKKPQWAGLNTELIPSGFAMD